MHYYGNLGPALLLCDEPCMCISELGAVRDGEGSRDDRSVQMQFRVKRFFLTPVALGADITGCLWYLLLANYICRYSRHEF